MLHARQQHSEQKGRRDIGQWNNPGSCLLFRTSDRLGVHIDVAIVLASISEQRSTSVASEFMRALIGFTLTAQNRLCTLYYDFSIGITAYRRLANRRITKGTSGYAKVHPHSCLPD